MLLSEFSIACLLYDILWTPSASWLMMNLSQNAVAFVYKFVPLRSVVTVLIRRDLDCSTLLFMFLFILFYCYMCVYGTVCLSLLSFTLFNDNWKRNKTMEVMMRRDGLKKTVTPGNYHFLSCCLDVHMFIFNVRCLAQETGVFLLYVLYYYICWRHICWRHTAKCCVWSLQTKKQNKIRRNF